MQTNSSIDVEKCKLAQLKTEDCQIPIFQIQPATEANLAVLDSAAYLTSEERDQEQASEPHVSA